MKLLKETKNIHKFLKIWTQYVRFRTKSGLAKTKFLYLYISEYKINNVLENVMSNVKLVSITVQKYYGLGIIMGSDRRIEWIAAVFIS